MFEQIVVLLVLMVLSTVAAHLLNLIFAKNSLTSTISTVQCNTKNEPHKWEYKQIINEYQQQVWICQCKVCQVKPGKF